MAEGRRKVVVKWSNIYENRISKEQAQAKGGGSERQGQKGTARQTAVGRKKKMATIYNTNKKVTTRHNSRRKAKKNCSNVT